MAVTCAGEHLDVPIFDEPLTIRLSADLQRLRDRALVCHQERHLHFEGPIVTAEVWQTHTPDEPWYLWRGRRSRDILRGLTIDLEPGELLAGKPLLQPSTPELEERSRQAAAVLADVPPTGSDAGHFHPDWTKLLSVGIGAIRREVADLRAAAADPETEQFYAGCELAMSGMAEYCERVAAACEDRIGDDPARADEWRAKAERCRRLADAPPETFHDAIQLLWLGTVSLWFGENHGLTTPGRMDQHLRPFYEADIAAGRLDRRSAYLLICDLFIQENRILYAGSAISVMVGGREAGGPDVTNDLSYLVLAARLGTQLVYPTVGVCWHEETPAEFMDFCMRVLASGIGCPAFFNDELIAEGLRDHGVGHADSYDYMNSTCVEIKVVGRSNMWVTRPYFNLPKKLLAVMADAAAGKIATPPDWPSFQAAVRARLAARIGEAAADLHAVWKRCEVNGGSPMASCLIHDCLESGRDFDRGGARYNWVENSFVGLANLADGALAVKKLVYDRRELNLEAFHEILANNFAGREDLRQRIVNDLPHYGNDDPEADAMARDWAEFLITSTESHTVGLHRYVPGFFCWVMHGKLGEQTGATPDGRLAGTALADGAGAAQGRERSGPTASLLSTTCWCHKPVIGGLVHNIKFQKSLMRTAADRRALRSMVETYLRRGGFELQVNVTDAEDLIRAKQHPEEYQDLVVRVAGYSDYFVHLAPNVQDEVIARSAHTV